MDTDKKDGDIVAYGEAEIIRRMDAMESRGRERALYFMDIKEIITGLLTRQAEKSYLEGWNDCGAAVKKEFKKYT